MEIPNFTPRREARRIRCIKRQKLVESTPEELVRQKVLHWLVHGKEIDINNIKVESSVRFVTGDSGRADIVLLSEKGHRDLVIECKNADCPLGFDAVRQAKNTQTRWGAGRF